MKKNLIARVSIVVVTTLVILNLIIMIVPLAPVMPVSELDPSWMFGINQAVAQGLVFGQEFIFTFGPYGSLYTEQYHPATNMLMLCSTSAFMVGWALALFGLFNGRYRTGMLLLSIFLVSTHSRDLLILGYPFLVMLLAVSSWKLQSAQNDYGRLTVAVAFYILALIGLLPLVKLSTLPLCILATLIAFGILFTKGHQVKAIFILIIPTLSMCTLWILAGQPLHALPHYFINGSDIISGYTEAMAITGTAKMPVLYLIICISIAATILLQRSILLSEKIALLLIYASFLFITMKAGFVRHDGHALTAGAALVFATAMLLLFIRNKASWLLLIASLLLNNYIAHHYRDIHWHTLIAQYTQSYSQAIKGLYTRTIKPEVLTRDYKQALASINSKISLPIVSGTSDIYSYEQAVLLASTNTWSPRPIIQSYSVYTPKLAELNKQHLKGPDAPDNIFFRVQPIDHRLPSLEDGPSWPTLMQRYEVASLANDFLLLRKRKSFSDMPLTQELQQSMRIGIPFPIMNIKENIYARLKFKETLTGRLANIFFKTTSIQLELETTDGVRKSFRLIPKMAEAGFLLSPHIETTTDFAWMASNRSDLLPHVKQITLNIDPKYRVLWEPTVEIEILSFATPSNSISTHELIGISPVVDIPTDLPETTCVSAIDVVSTRPANGPAKQLRVMGWLVVDGKTGLAPDRVFVTLRSQSGKTLHYANSNQHARPDVGVHLNTPRTELVGFTALIDAQGLKGAYNISLAKQFNGRIEACSSPTHSIILE